jgi:hypothetical protein
MGLVMGFEMGIEMGIKMGFGKLIASNINNHLLFLFLMLLKEHFKILFTFIT